MWHRRWRDEGLSREVRAGRAVRQMDHVHPVHPDGE